MSFDRRAAFGLWSAVVVVLVATVAFSDSTVPAPEHDPEAFATLTDFLGASERGDWLVEYTFTRTRPSGEAVNSEITEARSGDVHVVRGPTSAEAEAGGDTFRCQIAGTEVSCLPVPAAESLGIAEILRTLVDTEVYVITTLPDETIAGEHAECFRVFASRGFVADVGIERHYCFATDAVPLRTRVVDLNVSDEMVAARVTRDPRPAALDALLRDLEAAAAEGAD